MRVGYGKFGPDKQRERDKERHSGEIGCDIVSSVKMENYKNVTVGEKSDEVVSGGKKGQT